MYPSKEQCVHRQVYFVYIGRCILRELVAHNVGNHSLHILYGNFSCAVSCKELSCLAFQTLYSCRDGLWPPQQNFLHENWSLTCLTNGILKRSPKYSLSMCLVEPFYTAQVFPFMPSLRGSVLLAGLAPGRLGHYISQIFRVLSPANCPNSQTLECAGSVGAQYLECHGHQSFNKEH